MIHGSFSKHFDEIKRTRDIFVVAGIDVLAPKIGKLEFEKDGFALFSDEKDQDPRFVELMYLHNLKQLGNNGFSYFVNPDGYIGKSTSYELGIAQITNTTCYFKSKLSDHPAYINKRMVISAESLANYITLNDSLPMPRTVKNEQQISKLLEDLVVPGSVVATGAIIEHNSTKYKENEILLVKTHKWGNRYSIVGGKVRRNERLRDALIREVKEETSLNGIVGDHICTFDQIKNSGYYQQGIQHIFVDNVVSVKSKKVKLNYEAQDYLWTLPEYALNNLDIEPNAKTTIELYLQQKLLSR